VTANGTGDQPQRNAYLTCTCEQVDVAPAAEKGREREDGMGGMEHGGEEIVADGIPLVEAYCKLTSRDSEPRVRIGMACVLWLAHEGVEAHDSERLDG
jgi:hypothetical protein